MNPILLINPNTSQATTQMMLEIARASLGAQAEVRGLTMASGVPMIVEEHDLRAAADAVGALDVGDACGVIVAAFGDPGIEALRRRLTVPVVGIGEAAMHEAAQHGRFGIATTTPALAASIDRKVWQLGLAAAFTGARFTPGDPAQRGSDPQALEAALAEAVQACVETDGAQAVVIGGGPLGRAAQALGQRFALPVIGPVPAACRAILRALDEH
ncbi:aspartate/glutamate racemase family protein [Paraburkholderia sacchari]|uniref:aspartate/glutamate racemase family protein n=1 Tax=Paraburkholderia sacchari TaxID=159450 RepID=UPI001BCFE977|nr:aspartate/glutamate racemase family protein [Paraburkholderia sacchari]